MDDKHLRALPAVEELAAGLKSIPKRLAVRVAREAIAAARAEIQDGADGPTLSALEDAVRQRAESAQQGTLRRVINGTGVVLHTNLGRAPLARAAMDAVVEAGAGYTTLEYELEAGTRSSRHAHVEPLLRDLSGAEAAIAVNNNAAAVLLALTATAAGREVIVSRGQVVEIGGSFRIPDILSLSGAKLVEVGTTNRTRVTDYERAISDRTAALLRVHPSNFRTVGFVQETSIDELCALARVRGLTVIDDIGSGALEPIENDPSLPESIAAGSDLVCASADKLLGGPQAGLICGTKRAVERCRAHPLARAMRLDKLQLAALAATLRVHRDSGPEAIPALAMLGASREELTARAASIASRLGNRARVRESVARPGGGALPLVELEGPVCEIDPDPLGPEVLAARMRLENPPVIGRISEGRVLLDPRTMSDDEARQAAERVRHAFE